MDQKKIDRINELAKKKKAEGLTPEEKVEQAKLREEYIEGYRRSVRHHIEGIKIVDEEGNDVTPEKLRQVQREKGLHGRSLEDPNSEYNFLHLTLIKIDEIITKRLAVCVC